MWFYTPLTCISQRRLHQSDVFTDCLMWTDVSNDKLKWQKWWTAINVKEHQCTVFIKHWELKISDRCSEREYKSFIIILNNRMLHNCKAQTYTTPKPESLTDVEKKNHFWCFYDLHPTINVIFTPYIRWWNRSNGDIVCKMDVATLVYHGNMTTFKCMVMCLQWKGQFCIFFIVNKSCEQAEGKVLVYQILTAVVCTEKAWRISTIVVQKHIKKLKCCSEWHGPSLQWTWAL